MGEVSQKLLADTDHCAYDDDDETTTRHYERKGSSICDSENSDRTMAVTAVGNTHRPLSLCQYTYAMFIYYGAVRVVNVGYQLIHYRG